MKSSAVFSRHIKSKNKEIEVAKTTWFWTLNVYYENSTKCVILWELGFYNAHYSETDRKSFFPLSNKYLLNIYYV